MASLFDHLDIPAVLAGLGAGAVVVLIWIALLESDPLTARLKNVTERRMQLQKAQKQQGKTRRPDQARVDLMKWIVQKFKLGSGAQLEILRIKLAQAGYRSRDALFVYLFAKAALPLVCGLVGFLYVFVLHVVKLSPMKGLCVVIGLTAFGLYLPDIYLKNTTQKRQGTLKKFIPDALDLLVICAEAGLSLDAGLDRVSREIGPACAELAEEIGLTSVELNFYPERAKALQAFAERVPLPSISALINTLIQTEKYGTPLAQALRVMSAEMREERMLTAEAKAAKLPATLTVPMMLFILPPLFVILVGPAALQVMQLMKK